MVSSLVDWALLPACTLLLAIGCGAGSSGNPGASVATGGSSGTSVSGGAGGSTATGGSPPATGGITGSSGVPGAGGGTSGSGGATVLGGGGAPNGSGGAGTCASPNAWDVTYGLDGSTFEIRDTPLGAGDQINTCAPPYTANNQIGPGTMTLRFANSGGTPQPGRAHVMAYEMDLEFTVPGSTSMHSALKQESVSGACGAASGTYAGTTIKWDDPGMDLSTVGNITCSGALCSFAGYPDGTPQPQDYTAPQALVDFVFSNGVGNVAMAEVLIMKDATSSEWMTIKGVETGRKAVCDCQ